MDDETRAIWEREFPGITAATRIEYDPASAWEERFLWAGWIDIICADRHP